jgi:hypothetical protein
MDKQKLWFYSSLLVTFFVIVILVTGSSLLTVPLDENNSIPLGTFITWAGMISLPLSIYWGIRQLRHPTMLLNRYLSIFLKVLLTLAMLWVPISYLLSGNISFSFAPKNSFQGGELAMKIFWIFSYGIASGTLLVLIVYWVSLLFKLKK